MVPSSPAPFQVPPHSLEGERSVLGAILRDPKSLINIRELLSPEDFYLDSHKTVYQSILNLYDKNQPIDLITVSDDLKRQNLLERVGGAVFLTEILDSVATSAHAAHYAQIVKDNAMLRRLNQAANEIATRSFKAEEEVDKLVDFAESQIFSISQQALRKDFKDFKSLVRSTYNEMASIKHGEGWNSGVTSGFEQLDHYLRGFQNGNFIILGARPSLGKTSLALDITRWLSITQKVPVAFFSLEMTAPELVGRLLCAQASVNLHDLYTGFSQSDDVTKLATAAGLYDEAQIYIDDSSYLSSMELRAKARRIKADKDIGIIIVDYLQLIHDTRRVESRQVEVSQISHSLKALAKELNIPVLALCQLTRNMEGAARGESRRKPQLSDLRESGSLEQDADVVLLLYKELKKNEEEESEEDRTRILEVAKNRNGPLGSLKLVFMKEFTSFRPYSMAQEPEEQ